MVTRGARGFTLIELTIAIVLLSIGLLALTGALARALRESTDARAIHVALRDAEGVADSVASADSAAAGTRVRAGYTLAWRAEACASVTCVRVIAALPRDTLSLLVARR